MPAEVVVSAEPEPAADPEPAAEPAADPPAARRANAPPVFPHLLHQLLHAVRENGQDHIIRFSEEGDAFWILDREAFLKEVSPNYFQFRSMASFRRQLCIYGFVRYEVGGRAGYRHEVFHRDHPERLPLIRRSKRA